MVLYLSISFNLKKKKLKRNTLKNQNYNLLADAFWASFVTGHSFSPINVHGGGTLQCSPSNIFVGC